MMDIHWIIKCGYPYPLTMDGLDGYPLTHPFIGNADLLYTRAESMPVVEVSKGS